MNETIVIALIVAFSSMMAPLLLAYLTNKQRRLEKQEDYKRQDEIADRVAAVAAAAAKQQAEVAERVQRVAEEAAQNAQRMSQRVQEVAEEAARNAETAAKIANNSSAKLDGIHTLVNSAMDIAIKAELDATKDTIVLMQEVVALHRAAGHEPTGETLMAIEVKRVKIEDLEKVVAERKRQTDVAQAQIRAVVSTQIVQPPDAGGTPVPEVILPEDAKPDEPDPTKRDAPE